MPKLVLAPYAGIMKRLPANKVVGDKKQYLLEAINYITTNGRIKTMLGNERYDSTPKGGTCQWSKRIYFQVGSDAYRRQFAVIGGAMYMGNDNGQTLNQVNINGSMDLRTEQNVFLSDATIEVSGNVLTFVVDGKYFYKFVPNTNGYWEQLPIKLDIDGGTIEPIDICVYQDRLWVLVKNRNVILFSKNLNPENFDDSTDAGLIQLPAGNGGFPQKMIVHNGFLNIIHEDYFTPVSGSSAATYGVKPGDIVYGYGTRAPRSVVTLKQYFGFLNSEDNEYYLTAGTLGSTSETPLSYDIQLGSLINPNKIGLVSAVHDPNIDCLRISYVRTGEYLPNAEVLYSLNEQKWAGETQGKNISGYCLWNGSGDDNELLTMRGDIGCLMFEGRTNNIDGAGQYYSLVTGDYADNYWNDCQFLEFFVDAKPFGTNSLFPLAYYLDGRNTTYGQDNVQLQGEVINLGLIEISAQDIMLQRVLPLIDRSKGRMIQFISRTTLTNTSWEIYSFMVNYNKQNTRTSKYTVGA